MTINQRLFTVMDNKGISNAELSKGTGIKQNTISDWRTKGTNPSSDKIYRICEYLGISCEYLLTGIKKTPGLLARGLFAISGSITVRPQSLRLCPC